MFQFLITEPPGDGGRGPRPGALAAELVRGAGRQRLVDPQHVHRQWPHWKWAGSTTSDAEIVQQSSISNHVTYAFDVLILCERE